MQIRRDTISKQTADAVRAIILSGALPEGERINEVHLARMLGVSRTPVREALGRLVAEGALRPRPRHGYFVRPLSREEFEQIYGIRPLLDPEALRLAGVPPRARLDRLQKLNQRLASLGRAEEVVDADEQWHLELIADCPNRLLLELIENMVLRTRRYELALMRERTHVTHAMDDHARILAALRENDLDGACAALKQNMQHGRTPVLEWLRQREAPPGQGRPE